MPTLDWIGKEKVINHHRDVPFKILEHKYGFSDKDGETNVPVNSGNMIIHGDNLEALKSLLPEYEGRIKCIYIDPPYNTGNENWIYNDNVKSSKINKWLNQVVNSDDLAKHDKWLCMMYPRIKLLDKLLAKDGVLLISIGDDEIQNLILICNEIFGEKRHEATFVWKSRTKPTNAGNAKYRPQKVTEYILLYSKSSNLLFNTLTGEDNYSYPNEDEDGKYRTTTILTSNLGSYKRETMRFEIAGYTPPSGQRWKAGEEIITELYNTNRLQFKDGVPMQKVYDYDVDEINNPLYTLIRQDLSGTAESGKTLLNKIIGIGHGFDTVKPLELISYLLEVFTKKDSIVLDSFAGTGTSAHAVLNRNIVDEGSRQFILIEMEDYANSITAERVKKVINGYGDNEGTGGSFDYFELGKPMFIGENKESLNEEVDLTKIREYIWYSETRAAFIPPDPTKDTSYFLGKKEGTAHYFIYEKDSLTTLDYDTLSTIRTKAGQYVIYADNCLLPKDFMLKKNIVFKKIPRDVTRF